MTTILVKDNKMYGDGQMTAGYISSYETKKIVNYGSAIVSGAGRWSHVVKFHQWVYDNLVAEAAQQEHPYVTIHMPEKMVDDDFLGLVLYPDGTVIKFEGCDNSYEVTQPVAIGSGEEFAISAAWNGIDGEQCIQTAIHFDTGSGGEVQVEGFDEEVEVSVDKLESLDKETLIRIITGELEEEEFDDLFGEGISEDGDPNPDNVDEPTSVVKIPELTLSKGYYDKTSDEHTTLLSLFKNIAIENNVKFAHNISIEKLYERVKDFVETV